MLSSDDENESFELSPSNFFEIYLEAPETRAHFLPSLTSKEGKKYLLPNPELLTGEEIFASVGLGFSHEGLSFRLECDKPVEKVFYPEIKEGDSFEIFIDTRDVKTSGFATKYCHHFFFLPELIDGRNCGEITRFRTEDSHPIADHKDLSVKSHNSSKHYILDIFIPSHCLYGFDPLEFDRIGFTYRINRPQDNPQHFTALSEEFKIEDQPALWSSIRLYRNELKN